MKKVVFKAFFQRIQDKEENFIHCWIVDTELEDSLAEELKESINEPIFSCAIWIGYVFVDDDDNISHIEGEWKDVTDKFYSMVMNLLNEDQDRPDL